WQIEGYHPFHWDRIADESLHHRLDIVWSSLGRCQDWIPSRKRNGGYAHHESSAIGHLRFPFICRTRGATRYAQTPGGGVQREVPSVCPDLFREQQSPEPRRSMRRTTPAPIRQIHFDASGSGQA